jgi:hypothetical protein
MKSHIMRNSTMMHDDWNSRLFPKVNMPRQRCSATVKLVGVRERVAHNEDPNGEMICSYTI